MAIIYSPKLTRSLTESHVSVDVTYDLQFQKYEKQPFLQFIEHIEILGAKAIPVFTTTLTYTPDKISRHMHANIPRHFFDLGTLPVQIHCRIKVVSTPLIGAEAVTNAVVVPSLAVRPYVPLKRLQNAIVAGLVAGAGLLMVAAAARRR